MSAAMIWIVSGSTGEYADFTQWLVRAFHTEEDAAAFRDSLLSAYRSLREQAGVVGYGQSYEQSRLIEERMRAFDPSVQVDYTGLDYGVQSVPLGGES